MAYAAASWSKPTDVESTIEQLKNEVEVYLIDVQGEYNRSFEPDVEFIKKNLVSLEER